MKSILDWKGIQIALRLVEQTLIATTTRGRNSYKNEIQSRLKFLNRSYFETSDKIKTWTWNLNHQISILSGLQLYLWTWHNAILLLLIKPHEKSSQNVWQREWMTTFAPSIPPGKSVDPFAFRSKPADTVHCCFLLNHRVSHPVTGLSREVYLSKFHFPPRIVRIGIFLMLSLPRTTHTNFFVFVFLISRSRFNTWHDTSLG